MKKLLLAALLLVSCHLFSQDSSLNSIFPIKNGSVYYEKIIAIDSVSKQKLFERAKLWGEKNKSQVNSEFTTDTDQGLISFNISFTEPMVAPAYDKKSKPIKTEWMYIGTMRMYLKENKAKIIIDNIHFSGIAATNLFKIELFKPEIESAYQGVDKKYVAAFINATYDSFKFADKNFNNLMTDAQTSMTKSEPDF